MAAPVNLSKLKVFPLAQRDSLARLKDILVPPDSAPPPCPASKLAVIRQCARHIAQARKKKAGVMLIYGAHLIKNGAASILLRLLQEDWITHLATNGAGAIHDWEFAFAGVSTESVKENVARALSAPGPKPAATFTSRCWQAALRGDGFGRALGRFVSQDGVTLPTVETLEAALKRPPAHALSPARAELLARHALASSGPPDATPWRIAARKQACWRKVSS